MHTQQINEKTFLIDDKTGGIENLIASYVLRGKKVIIVDCGPSSSIPNLLSGLDELGIEREDVAYLAETHVHIDHSGGVGTLLHSLPNAKVVVHPRGAPHLIDPVKLWEASKETLTYVAEIFGKPQPVDKNRIVIASEGMIIDAGGGVQLQVVEALGHSAHNVSYFEPKSGELFPGDSTGAYLSKFDTVLPTTPPPFRPDMALATIEKLINLNPKVIYYPHFGYTSDAVERLRKYAEQIKQWLRIAQDGVKKGETIEAIRDRLFREDITIREELRAKIIAAIEANPVHRKTLLGNSVEGFVDFARKSAL